MSFVRARRLVSGIFALVVLAAAGCSTDDPVPACRNCEFWTQLSPGLARFPEPHPAEGSYLLYSTIDKTLGAPDENRDADEDIWLMQIDGTDPSQYPRWQLTDDALGLGDNSGARWSPSGTQVAFVHSSGGGTFEVWRMPVTLPAGPGGTPTVGTPERLARSARDVTWVSETRLVFTRADKLYRLDIPAGPGPATSPAKQISFDPPLFASTEKFIDRHPMFANDGGGLFNTIGRRNVADVLLRAFEIDDTVFPPDTVETGAYVSYKSPSAQDASYPIFMGADTVKTPALLRSVPVDQGGVFNLGVRRDSRFIANPFIESYCDTLLAVSADLRPGDVDTVTYYFKIVRGGLEIRSGIGQTKVFWTRQDARETISDFTANTTIGNAGGALSFACLMPFAIEAGQINPARQETLLVTGSRGSLADTLKVLVNPGKTTVAQLFPTGTISGTVTFSDMPPVPLPQALVNVRVAGTSELVASAVSSDSTGQFVVTNVPKGAFDVAFSVPGSLYVSTTRTGISVTPPADTPIGVVQMNRAPRAPAEGRDVARRSAPVVLPPVSERAGVVREVTRSLPPAGVGASAASVFRAPGDLTTIWRLDLGPTQVSPPTLTEIFGSEFQVQNPAVTQDFGGVRYVAYASDETGVWQLYVQRLQNWAPDGDPLQIDTPGSTDNLSCARDVFHPRWVPGTSPGALELVVALGDCPNNGFEELGIDDDPWAVGEIRIWQVQLPAGL